MPLDLTMMYSAVRICGDKTDDAGRVTHIAHGTGFIVTIPSERIPGHSRGYVVTPHHVIADLTNIEVEAANPSREGELYPAQPITDWRKPAVHPKADLAFAPYPIPAGRSLISLPYGSLVQPGLLVPLGGHIHYVGLLAPLGVPMARSGTVGALDVPGIKHDGPYEYPAHLVDARSYSGFSGSPCYIEYPMAKLEPIDKATFPVRLPRNFEDLSLGPTAYLYLFCGMWTEHLHPRNITSGPISYLGVGVVMPADLIIEELMTDAMRHERNKEDEQWLASQPDSVIQALSASDSESGGSDEFERFEDLTRKLTQVPKKELDQKRAEEGQ